MSNETNNTVVEEPIQKTSKLKKLGRNLAVAGIYAIPVAATGASCYYSWKLISMNLETAKLQLEAAKNAAQQ
jgi:hypothetical protein